MYKRGPSAKMVMGFSSEIKGTNNVLRETSAWACMIDTEGALLEGHRHFSLALSPQPCFLRFFQLLQVKQLPRTSQTLSVYPSCWPPAKTCRLDAGLQGASMTDKTGWTEPRAATMGIAFGPASY